MNVPSCFYERKCIRQFNNHAQFVQAVCLVEILIIVHFKHISLHSYNPPCLQDVCPAKQPLVRTALILTDLLTRYEGRTLVVFGDEPFLSRVGVDEGGGGGGGAGDCLEKQRYYLHLGKYLSRSSKLQSTLKSSSFDSNNTLKCISLKKSHEGIGGRGGQSDPSPLLSRLMLRLT